MGLMGGSVGWAALSSAQVMNLQSQDQVPCQAAWWAGSLLFLSLCSFSHSLSNKKIITPSRQETGLQLQILKLLSSLPALVGGFFSSSTPFLQVQCLKDADFMHGCCANFPLCTNSRPCNLFPYGHWNSNPCNAWTNT